MIRKFILPCCVLLLTFSGCGYTTRSIVSTQYRTIYITPFVNKIDFTNEGAVSEKYKVYRPLLESEITKSVINKFMFDGNLKPVKNESADVILKGDLVDFRKDALRNSDAGEVDEYRMNISVDISLRDKQKDTLLWEEKGFTGDFTYFPTSSTLPGVTKKTDDQAVTDAIADLSRRIVQRAVEQW